MPGVPPVIIGAVPPGAAVPPRTVALFAPAADIIGVVVGAAIGVVEGLPGMVDGTAAPEAPVAACGVMVDTPPGPVVPAGMVEGIVVFEPPD